MKKILVFFIVFYNVQLCGSDDIINKIEQCPGGYTVTINSFIKNTILTIDATQKLINDSQQLEIKHNKDKILQLIQKDNITIVSEEYWKKLNEAAREAKVNFNKNNPKKRFHILERIGFRGHSRGLQISLN